MICFCSFWIQFFNWPHCRLCMFICCSSRFLHQQVYSSADTWLSSFKWAFKSIHVYISFEVFVQNSFASFLNLVTDLSSCMMTPELMDYLHILMALSCLLVWAGLLWRRIRKSLLRDTREELCCRSRLSSWRKKSNDEMFFFSSACLRTLTLSTQHTHPFIRPVNDPDHFMCRNI